MKKLGVIFFVIIALNINIYASNSQNVTNKERIAEIAQAFIEEMTKKQAGTSKPISVYSQGIARIFGYSGKAFWFSNDSDSLRYNYGNLNNACVFALDCSGFVDLVLTKALCLPKNSFNSSSYKGEGTNVCKSGDCASNPAMVVDFYSYDEKTRQEKIHPSFDKIGSVLLNDNEGYYHGIDKMLEKAQKGDLFVVAGFHIAIYLGKNGEDHLIAEYSPRNLDFAKGQYGYGISVVRNIIGTSRNHSTMFALLRYKGADNLSTCDCGVSIEIPALSLSNASKDACRSEYNVVSNKTILYERNFCPSDNCYMNKITKEYKWQTTSPGSEWESVPNKTKETCQRCYVNKKNNSYIFTTISPGSDYTIDESIESKDKCQITYQCFYKDNEYLWSKEDLLKEGWQIVDRTEDNCQSNTNIVNIKIVDNNGMAIDSAIFKVLDSNGRQIMEKTSVNGVILISGLEDGQYQLEQTYVPSPYKLSHEKVSFEVGENKRINNLVFTNVYENNNHYWLFLIIGILTLFLLIVIFYKKKKQNNDF